ncbi:bifunctional chorismate synthase/riboflavin reductase [NAD(P)H] aro2 [Claviceps purpurea]|uniref:chorismate synthase n=1 Tax=Claviceps purpurea (strain 20.1) TaxID=1111077 RepID=M1WHE6_CLAP2|nr:bifunctional chorismate synthase/riboflavin reductase [NAD(P)H] aro2 [Claviceps purpurea]CCE32594.1 probable chorismate synthase/flavin reductase,NADPH-dependent [Claviceps purpurea 20.1]KAG6131766.1 bifunctional chorismate synthase/riboflavin reductase [NAD(P)H] aro2 [Claviceps purpurea]KAG6134177.1 bifunctional chorismate synthase/riboflavin reductase [NAD(P)H] aro2 [Claviceps purpurea]KAG6153765.1 bifunctional chorismate synthase/riboflavin reductase [NAD(P)H] aro2 [Claviceps purpurea]
MSTFGHYFRVTTAGESHGKSVSCIIDNCPPGLELSENDIQPQLNRRRPGQSAITTPRNEKDKVTIHSGTEFGRTLGTPILLTVPNEDQRPKDYGDKTIDLYPRPSHADWTYLEKYAIKASSGGGRSSARETIARVAAGAVAEKWLKDTYGVEIIAFVTSVGRIKLFSDTDAMSADPAFLSLADSVTRAQVDEFLPVRCPDAAANKRMEDHIAELRDQHDSTGGTVTCVIRNAPSGLGEPAFDKMEALLGHAMMSIPAVKGFEIGSGFLGAEMNGSTHNDAFIAAPVLDAAAEKFGIPRSRLHTKTNHSGGIQGGISNGMPIFFRVAFKPPATISKDQMTATYDGSGEGVLAAKGRHDPCVVPRAVPIVEGMAALAIADAVMAQHARRMGIQIAKAT